MKYLLRRFCWEWVAGGLLLSALFVCSYQYLAGVAVADMLTLTTFGTGAGTVKSTPAGIDCVSGSSANCSAAFANMSGITLTATPDWKSLAGIFSGGCSGVGSCFFNIDGSTSVTATFNPNNQAALIITHPEIEPKFATLGDAYSYASTNGNNDFTLAAREYTFYENLILTQPLFFTLAGGKDSGYYTHVGFTTLNGYLEVQAGSIDIDSLIIQ